MPVQDQQTRELTALKQRHATATRETCVANSNSHLACELMQGTQTPPVPCTYSHAR